jgi:hypothetical protein
MGGAISRRWIIRRPIRMLERWWQGLCWQHSKCTFSCRLSRKTLLTHLSVLWVATAGLLWLAMRVQTSSPPHQAESSSSRAQPTTVEATRNPPPHTEPWEHFATAPQGHMQPNAAELPQMSSPRTEAWENHVAVPPRSGPEPILPDSVDDDDAFSHYSQSPVSDGEDPEYTGGRREIIRNFGPQQAPYSGYDPYVRGVIIHQVPADGRSVRVETAQSPQFQVPSNWHVVN